MLLVYRESQIIYSFFSTLEHAYSVSFLSAPTPYPIPTCTHPHPTPSPSVVTVLHTNSPAATVSTSPPAFLSEPVPETRAETCLPRAKQPLPATTQPLPLWSWIGLRWVENLSKTRKKNFLRFLKLSNSYHMSENHFWRNGGMGLGERLLQRESK